MYLPVPQKVKIISDRIELPFEPTVQDILNAQRVFVEKHGADPKEIKIEELNDSSYRSCECCGTGGLSLELVFYRYIPNPNYDKEMEEYKIKQLAWKKQQQQRDTSDTISRNARREWKDIHRQNRLARRDSPHNHLLDDK